MLKCEAVEPDGKSCSKCGEYKGLEEYQPKPGKYGRAAACRSCVSKSSGHCALKRLYGINIHERDTLMVVQHGRCGICRVTFSRSAHTDHDHVSGRVRGLLCGNCNRGLGFFQDNPDTMRLAAAYVETHRG